MELVTLALKTRVAAIVLQSIANLLIPDHNAEVFVRPKSDTATTCDNLIEVLFGGFERWDGQHFLHIAKHGYVYENSLAFFPLFPFLVAALSWVLRLFLFFLNDDSLLVLAAVILNVYMFIEAVKSLYELSLKVTKSEKVAYKASLLFCLNPATVFFIAPYTECLFSLLTFKAMSKGSSIAKVVLIMLSSCTRSNGLLNVGFLAYDFVKTRALLLKSLVTLTACIVPFAIFQLFGYYTFCMNFQSVLTQDLINFGNQNDLILLGRFSHHNQSWCYNKLPLPYSYVQDTYWNVGFMRYFELKQLPNFILALPVVALITLGGIEYFRQHPNLCLNLGIFKFKLITCDYNCKQYYTEEMFVFVAHAAFLAVFCFFCIHVQVTTRMLFSASPVPYWFAAYYFRSCKVDVNGSMLKLYKFTGQCALVHWYFWGYTLLGIVMFCNFLPWT